MFVLIPKGLKFFNQPSILKIHEQIPINLSNIKLKNA